jgi:hypothetical protein
MQLKDLMLDTKSVWVDYPGLKGFEVEVAMLSKQELTKLRKDCTITRIDRKTRVPMEELDEEKFVAEFTRKTIKGWKGLTLEHLQSLILIDVGSRDLNEELEYSEENAETLVTSSTEFDSWLNEVVFDLDNFRN